MGNTVRMSSGTAGSETAQYNWAGAALIRPGLLVVAGAMGTAEMHAHHTVQLIAGRTEIVLGDSAGEYRQCRAAIIPADVPHKVVEGAADAVLVHIDPESSVGMELGRTPQPRHSVGGWMAAATRQRLEWPGRDEPKQVGLRDVVGEWLDGAPWSAPTESANTANTGGRKRVDSGSVNSGTWLGGASDPASTAAPDMHPAVSEVVRLLPGRLTAGPIRLRDIAREVHISESRLAHVFSSEIGLPFRPYLLWLRLQRAVELIAAGHSLTAVAHGAGFSDSAHLTRVCRRMFGGPPSLFSGIHWDVEPAPVPQPTVNR